MLRIAGIVVVIVLVVAAGILIYAASKPDDFRVQRSLAIKAATSFDLQLCGFHCNLFHVIPHPLNAGQHVACLVFEVVCLSSVHMFVLHGHDGMLGCWRCG